MFTPSWPDGIPPGLLGFSPMAFARLCERLSHSLPLCYSHFGTTNANIGRRLADSLGPDESGRLATRTRPWARTTPSPGKGQASRSRPKRRETQGAYLRHVKAMPMSAKMSASISANAVACKRQRHGHRANRGCSWQTAAMPAFLISPPNPVTPLPNFPFPSFHGL